MLRSLQPSSTHMSLLASMVLRSDCRKARAYPAVSIPAHPTTCLKTLRHVPIPASMNNTFFLGTKDQQETKEAVEGRI